MAKKIKVELKKDKINIFKKDDKKEANNKDEKTDNSKFLEEQNGDSLEEFLLIDNEPTLKKIADDKPIEILEEDLADVPVAKTNEEKSAVKYSNFSSSYSSLGSESASSEYKLMMNKSGVTTIKTNRREGEIGFVNPDFNSRDDYSKPGGNEEANYRSNVKEDTEIERLLPGQRRKNF
ncbi:MAG: hypothetical protein WC781_01185 [Candidatus Pacearchaeota archaeon]